MSNNKQLWLTPAQNEVFNDPARFKVLVAGRRTGKALALTTPILTMQGWKTMGTIESGDKVFDGCGQICNVVAVSEVFYRRPCFQVTFSDKSHIIADIEHEWNTYRQTIKSGRNTYERRVRTTGQIIDLMAPDRAPRIWVEQGATARYVKRIDPFISVPTRCIEVDSPQRLYLAGKSLVPTHNSRLLLNTIIFKSTNYKGLYDPASPPVVVLTMPYLKMVRAIFWNPLINLLANDSRVEKIYKSDFRIAMKGNHPDILLRGSNDDDGDNLRGLKLFFVGVDECQDVKLSVIQQVIIPALTDTQQSGALFIGTPKGKSTPFYKFAMDAKEQKDWAYFHKTTFDNPFIDGKEIIKQKKNLPPKVFKQEFLASWESFGGQIYTELSSQHLLSENALPESYDNFYMGIDWGDVNPAIVVLGEIKGVYYVLETWENPNPETAIEQHTHTQAIIDLSKKYPITRAYADPSQPGRIMNVRSTTDLKVISGYNRVSEGNGLVNALLFQNKLFFSDKCEKAFDLAGAYHRQIKNDIILDEVAPKQDDHLCFVGETQVLTEYGWQAISTLKAGDKVWNREGLQLIEITMSHIAQTIVLQNTKNEQVLRCTPEHPFITSQGVVTGSCLSYANEIISMNKTQWLTLLTTWLMEKLLGSIREEEVTTDLIHCILNEESVHYTEKCGNRLTEKYQKGAIFITKMVILKIMILVIWSALIVQTTLSIIVNKDLKGKPSIWKKCKEQIKKKLGGILKRVKNGIEKTEKDNEGLLKRKTQKKRVLNVLKNTLLAVQKKVSIISAPTTVEPSIADLQEKTTRIESAPVVKKFLASENLLKPCVAVEAVETVCDLKRVYNLKIKGAPEFFVRAGNTALLCHNCDATRYVLASLEHKNMELFIKPKLDESSLVKVVTNDIKANQAKTGLYNKRHYA